jgi:hypothetical protein
VGRASSAKSEPVLVRKERRRGLTACLELPAASRGPSRPPRDERLALIFRGDLLRLSCDAPRRSPAHANGAGIAAGPTIARAASGRVACHTKPLWLPAALMHRAPRVHWAPGVLGIVMLVASGLTCPGVNPRTIIAVCPACLETPTPFGHVPTANSSGDKRRRWVPSGHRLHPCGLRLWPGGSKGRFRQSCETPVPCGPRSPQTVRSVSSGRPDSDLSAQARCALHTFRHA